MMLICPSFISRTKNLAKIKAGKIIIAGTICPWFETILYDM
jgi:hypothetical protein